MTDHYAVVNPEDLEPVAQAGPPFVCEICQRTFQTTNALGVHFRTHGSGKEPCPECGAEYYPGPGMSRHRQTQHGAAKANGDSPKPIGGAAQQSASGQKKFCPECHKPIRSKDLLRHRRQVHGYTPVKTPTVAVVPDQPDDITVDEVFDAVVGVLFPRGVIPITALPALLRWRHATDILLEEVSK